MHQTYCLGTSDLDFRSKLARPFSHIHHLYSLTPYERTFPESYLIGKFAARTNSPVFGATPQLLDKYQEDKHDIREPENSSCIVWLHK